MKRILICFLLLGTFAVANAQKYQKEAAKIEAEGKALYRVEKASWVGTDVFLAQFDELKTKAGGYFSYLDGDIARCIFYSQDEVPQILVTIDFKDSFKASTAIVSDKKRPLSKEESKMLSIRIKTSELMKTDTLFKYYNNCNLNVVPFLWDGVYKSYVLTGPKITGVIVLGNDYEVIFDKKLKVKSKRMIHKNIIPIEYGEEGIETSVHSHLKSTGVLITPTDICTLMLYAPYAKMRQHIVLNDEYVSIWNCKKNSLFVLTTKAWDRINERSSKDGFLKNEEGNN